MYLCLYSTVQSVQAYPFACMNCLPRLCSLRIQNLPRLLMIADSDPGRCWVEYSTDLFLVEESQQSSCQECRVTAHPRRV